MDARETLREPSGVMVNSYGSGGVRVPNSSPLVMPSSVMMPNSGMQLSFGGQMENAGGGLFGDGMRQGQVGGSVGETVKKKRGRPRKYGTDGGMALALSPATNASSSSPGNYSNSPMSEPGGKKRGRPLGSGKRQQLNALGSGGIAFTPHVITVKAGEDVASKIMAFSQQGPRTVCILSANGAICNVTLRQPATSGGTVTYEGRFEIISLSGSFILTENGGTRSRTGGLSVALAGSDGRVLGGGVAGMLMAATPVQVVMGSFIAAQGKKPKPEVVKREPISVTPVQMAGFVPASESSPLSQGTSSDSDDEDPGGGSPHMNQSGDNGTGNNSSQHVQTMPAYNSVGGWSHPANQHRHDSDMKMMP